MHGKFLLALLAAAATAFGAERPPEPNVLMITVDTLRADHLSCYGYHLRTSPNIDKLAEEGVRFADANTTIPLTGPSHISLFTSRYPQEHGARINGLAHNEETKLLFLPQILRRFGYRTAAFVSAWPLTARLTHLDRWFDEYDEDLPRTYQMFNSQRWAEDVAPRAIRWLQKNDHEPFFLWVHFFDPHEPYDLREAFADPEQIAEPGPRAPEMNSEEARERVRRYDSEIRYADHWIGEILKTVDRLGLRDNTLVVLLSDHGESLGEHDYVGHGRQLYQPIVHVPLIFRYPGKIPAGKVIDTEVSLLDVTPTIIDLALREHHEELHLPVKLGGRSLAASLTGGPPPDQQLLRYVTFAGRKGWMPKFLIDLFVDFKGLPLKMGQRLGDRKVIWTPKKKALEILNVEKDPLELEPVKPPAGSPQYRAETARLRRWFEQTAAAAGENRMTEEDVKVLKSLGYLQ